MKTLSKWVHDVARDCEDRILRPGYGVSHCKRRMREQGKREPGDTTRCEYDHCPKHNKEF